MKKPKKIDQLKARIENCRIAIGKERDKLRVIQDELSEILPTMEQAHELLGDTIELISQTA